jgi:hypothetical protein
MTLAVHPSLLELAGYLLDCGHIRPANLHTYTGGDGHPRVVCRACERNRKREADARRAERTRVGKRATSVITIRMLQRTVVRSLPVVQDLTEPRPSCRSECADVPRPCPFVGCKFNLFLDVSPKGSIRLNFPNLEPDEVAPDASCALDIADAGGISGEQVGRLLNISREGVRQIEVGAFEKLQQSAAGLRDELEES